MSPIEGNDAVLTGALRDFTAYWERTAAVWKDAARDHFERDFVRELVDSSRVAATAISQIEVLLNQIQKECS
jgi:hypothetical protein